MKKIYTSYITVLTVLACLLLPNKITAQPNTVGCPNTDFSAGNFSNWNQRRGTTSGNGVVTWDGTKGNFEIITAPGNDPNCPGLAMIPPGYTRVARINYNQTQGYSASEISYTMTVTAQNALFVYNYAVVFGDPSHSTAQQPWFNIAVTDQANNLIPCTQYLVTIGSGSTGYINGSGINRYKPWTKVGVNLASFIGQTITIRLSAGHCGAGASSHWGYAYVVAECQPMEIEVRYCVGDTTAVLVAPDGFETYTWQPGGHVGQSLTIQNPQPGLSNYTVNLTSNNGQCQAQLNVLIDPVVPVADFDTLSLCQQGAQFTDQSTVNRGTISQWNWDFGDGGTSTAQSPTHHYSAPGMYNVRLINRTNIGCRDTIDRVVYIKPNPLADFNMSGNIVSVSDPNMYCAPGAIFTDNSTHIAPWDDTLSVVAWNWNFGGGNTSTVQNPTFNFPSEGTHTITLIVTDNRGCRDTITRNWTNNRPPIADFATPPLCGLTGAFTDQSVDTSPNGSIVNWSWSFGDGGTSTTQHPPHTYTAQGTRNVTLIVTDAAGCKDTIVKPFRNNEFPVAGLTLPVGCGLIQTFTDNSSDPVGEPLSWAWNFGDGGTSSTQNPTHTFTQEANFNITLIVTDTAGCRDTVVVPYTTRDFPIADFSTPQLCGLTGTFTDQSVDQSTNGSIVAWNWDFGDGGTSTAQNPPHTYTSQGTRNVTLIVTDIAGCNDTIVKPFRNNQFPVANLDLPLGCGLTQTFLDHSSDPVGEPLSWAWSFGDGGTSTAQNPTHGYSQEAIWNITLIVTDTAGCRDTIVVPYQSKEYPTADFGFTNVCYGVNMPFTDQTVTQVATINQWNWNFGSGQTDNTQNPVNNFPAYGDYNTTLIVTTALGCSDTAQKVVTVHPLPIVSFTAPQVCHRNLTQFTNSSTIPLGTIDSYLWDFGTNVAPSNLTNPSLVYPADGTFNVQLIATSNLGCRDSVTIPVIVNPRPIVDFVAGPLVGCYPFNVSFTNQSTINLGSIASYTWSFGYGNSSNATNTSYMYPNTDGLYTVSLYAISDRGCDTLITKNNYIRVWHKPTADFAYNPSHPNVNDPLVHFNNLSVAADSYQWYFEQGVGSSSLFEPFHLFPADTGLYEVELVAITVNGCTDTIIRYVHIGPDYLIYIPNSFTPNGDKTNDVYKIVGSGVNNSTMIIFNRWGEPLITLDNNQIFDIGWDGTHNGNIVQQDVYTYKLEIIDMYNKKHTYMGNINLIR